MNKNVIIVLLALELVITGGGLVYVWQNQKQGSSVSEEKQLYTCGMHPDIISDEPGNCPICEMKLTPIKNTKSSSPGERKVVYWRAPMDPNEIYDSPGKSKMGMDLVPVYEDEAGSAGVVTIDGTVQQNMNVRIGEVKVRDLSTRIVTNGIVTIDERNEYMVTTKVNGWIEKMYVNYTGQKVKKGQKLIDIYSPELVAAQQELISALSYKSATENSSESDILKSGQSLVENTIKKLELLDISKKDIEKLIDTREINKYMTLYSPMDGTVLMKNVIEGEKIAAGKSLLHIADLSRLWLKADIYESELNKLTPGATAEIRFSYKPGYVYTGKVTFIYPTVDPKTRTVQLRIDLSNPGNDLKPAMFAKVEITGRQLEELPSVDENAVLRSGEKSIVILSLGEGKFKPVEVRLGEYSQGYYQVLSGLKADDKIVESAQFMIDSESSLKAAVNMYGGAEAESGMDGTDDTMRSEMKHDHSGHESELKMANDEPMQEEMYSDGIVRTGLIDLEAIDINKDGKVYQDLMDWNVLSDEAGRCPVCEMFLSEVDLETAKSNLLENGYKVK